MSGAAGEDSRDSWTRPRPLRQPRRGVTLTQQIFIGLAPRHRRRRDRRRVPSGMGRLLPAVQPAVPAADQDDHRAADLCDAGRGHRRRGALQGGRPDGAARDHLLRDRHDARAHHRARRGEHHEARASASTCRWGRGRRSPPRRRRGTRSSCTSCPSRSSTRWRRGDVLQIVVFSMFFGIALGMIGEKGRPVARLVRGGRRDDVQVHEHRHALRADRRRRGHRLHRRPRRPRRALQPRLAGGDAVHGARRADPRGLPADRPDVQGAAQEVHQGGQGAGRHRVLHDLERSGAAARDGSARAARRAAAHRVVRAAARLQLQPRRHDALPVAGVGVRRAGGRRASSPSGSRSRCC